MFINTWYLHSLSLSESAGWHPSAQQFFRFRCLFPRHGNLTFISDYFSKSVKDVTLTFLFFANGWVYETFGISKRYPIKPL
jgi:hypothetical protein